MTNMAVLLAVAVFAIVGVTQAELDFSAAVSNVTMTQRENAHIVDIGYTLSGEDAIVTLSIETNGVTLPDSAMTQIFGDVCKVVQPGDRSISWNTGVDWPGHAAATHARARVKIWSTKAPPQVMVIDLSQGQNACETNLYPVYYYTSLTALPNGGVSNDVYKTEKLVLNKIPLGKYDMGCQSTLSGASVPVRLTQDFYVGVYQVTWKQWYRVMDTGSAVKDPFYPFDRVSYYDIRENPDNSATVTNWPQSSVPGANSFMGRLRSRTGLRGFDLPTEAQWEYACRAETATDYNVDAALDELGWYADNSESKTHPVGRKKPNTWGLYDMHGNVWEWCLDWYASSLAGGDDPKGPVSGSYRVVRGGSWYCPAAGCRSVRRCNFSPSRQNSYYGIGFRLVRTLP